MLVLVLLFLAIPVAELYVIVQSSHAIGFVNTLGLLVAVSLIGGWLVRRQGLRVWNRFNRQLEQGGIPSKEIVDGALVLLAGALLLTPGFITDAVGVLLLLPPVRAVVRAVLVRRWRSRPPRITATYVHGDPFDPFGARGSVGPEGVIDVDSADPDDLDPDDLDPDDGGRR